MKLYVYKLFIFFFNFFFNLIRIGVIRKILLFLVGAKIGKNLTIFGFCTFDFPWRLTIGNNCYITSVYFDCRGGKINIGNNSDISENTKIYTLTHNIYSKNFRAVGKKVIIQNRVWISSNCVILPGSFINDGCVISASSTVSGILRSYTLYRGNYAKKIKSLPINRAIWVRRDE